MARIIYKGTFKGSASTEPERWIEGHRDGKEIALHGLPMECGPYGKNWGSGGHTKGGGGYGEGYAEGTLYGRVARRYCKAIINIFGTHE